MILVVLLTLNNATVLVFLFMFPLLDKIILGGKRWQQMYSLLDTKFKNK